MKINLPDRQRWLVIGVGGIVALFLLARVLFTPLTNMWKAHSEAIVKLQKSVSDGRNAIARAARTEREWADMVSNALPKDQGQAEQEVSAAITTWEKANRIEAATYRLQWMKGKTERYSRFEVRVDA